MGSIRVPAKPALPDATLKEIMDPIVGIELRDAWRKIPRFEVFRHPSKWVFWLLDTRYRQALTPASHFLPERVGIGVFRWVNRHSTS